MGTPALWAGFTSAVLAFLALDLWVFNRRAEPVSMGRAALWSAVCVAGSLGFNYWILRTHGSAPALSFFTGYVLEKSLSADNLVVFLLVFRAFGVQERFQHRVLFWGVLGALLLRGLMVGAGVALVNRFAWILYLFGAFLVLAGIRTLVRGRPASTRSEIGSCAGRTAYFASPRATRARVFSSSKTAVVPSPGSFWLWW